MSDYKRQLGIHLEDSIFQQPNIMETYEELKQQVMEEFHKANPEMSFDFEKKVLLDEIESIMEEIIQAFLNKDYDQFGDAMTKIAYLAIIKKEYQLASKAYNITAHAYMSWKKFL